MGKASKATKKFQKSHLKRTIDQRRVEQKYKKKIGGDKKKRISNDHPEPTESAEDDSQYDGMSIDEFMKTGFEVPETKEKSKNDKKSSIQAHKDDLSSLAEKDPEFYKYLQDNDSGLLDFDAEEPSDDEDDDEEQNSQLPVEAGEESDDDETKRVEVTTKLVKSWSNSLDKHSLRTLKTVLRAFNAAVHTTTDDEARNYKYTITDPQAFNNLLIVTLSKAPQTLKHHIAIKDKQPQEGKKLRAITPSLKGLISCMTILLNGAHSKTTTLLILKSVNEILPFFLTFRRLLKELISAITNVWCGSEAEDECRLAAFSLLKSSAETYPKSLLEMVIKSTYGGIVKCSRKTNIHTMPVINLLKNSAATLYSIDPVVGYQQGFQFIRQLAIHLRSGIVSKTADSYKAIYNWQFVHSLDFWSRVLCIQCNTSNVSKPSSAATALRELIHPLVQVTLGAIRLIPTSQYFALRFYLTRSLLRLSSQTGVYIPLLPIVTEILSSTVITKAGKPSTLKPFDFDHNIRANKAYLGTRIYQDGVCEQLVELVAEFFGLYCKSIAFPELAIPAIVQFKSFTKKNKKNIKFNRQLQRLLEKLDENSKLVSSKRSNVDFGPTNRTQVNAFLKDYDWQKTPMGALVTVQRQVAEERARILRESLEENNQEEEEEQEDDDEDIISESEDEENGADEDESDDGN